MSETIFATKNLNKQYQQLCALDSINMNIKRGDIYGFVGENGAGKTTFIRILAGLAVQTSGEISLFGISETGQLPKQRMRMGGIVESPALYPNLSALENLEICRLQRGIPGKDCILQALQTVNLTDTGKKKAKHFSLGMKQRLGLAMALMNAPEFLILDEPVNGLDPAGIVEFRELLKMLNRERGITILISSHILGELYQLATRYGFIHKGKMVEQITLEELDEKCKKHLCVLVDDAPKAAAVLETALHTQRFEMLPNNTIRLYDFLDRSGEVSKALFSNGVTVVEISVKGDNLEDYYMSLIGGRS
jgi:ABC-2 type transport system ATP-binding protein